jgi:hypothetical protein
MSAAIQASPLESLSRESWPTGDSCVLVIFGASGDLTNRKLMPALYNLACVGCMNPEFEVLGIGARRRVRKIFARRPGSRKTHPTSVSRDGLTLKHVCTTWSVTLTIRSSIRSCAFAWRRCIRTRITNRDFRTRETQFTAMAVPG